MQSEGIRLLTKDKRFLNQLGVTDLELLEEGLRKEARSRKNEINN
jgi:hypothetical protein